MGLSIGYAQTKITPDLEKTVYLAGFDQNRTPLGIHDDLWVRATALKSGKSACKVLISLDLIGLGFVTCQRIREKINAEVPKAAVLISTTHTHHGPDTLGLWGKDWETSGVDADYLDWLVNTTAETALRALENLRPGKMRIGKTIVPRLIKNTRNPEILDEELLTVQFFVDEKPLVTWVNFSSHPEALWKENRQITSDYPHFLRTSLEECLGGAVVFLPGALGGMLTPDVTEHSFLDAQRMGQKLAEAADAALDQSVWLEDPDLNLETALFRLPVENPVLKGALTSGLVVGAYFEDDDIISRVSLFSLGDIYFALVPGEVLPELGFQIKELMLQSGAKFAGIIGLTDDELGYILPEEAYQFPEDPFNPGKHYEETMSVGKMVGTRLLEKIRLLSGQD